MLWKQWQLLFSWAPKSLRMLTAAMKLKDSCSLEEKLWHTYVCSVAQSCLTLWDPMDCSPQASLSMEFSRQEYWSGLPFISPKKNLDSVLKSRDIVLLKVAKGPYSQSYGFSGSHVWMWELDHKEGWVPKTDAFKLWAGEDSWESFGKQWDETSLSWKKSTLNIHWKDQCWNWSYNTLTT